MNSLGDIIKVLKACPDSSRVARIGLGGPMSYRGYYDELAFEPEAGVSVQKMLERARSALGKTFTGYKGGDYTMGEWTQCWLSRYGYADGDAIGPVMLAYLTGMELAEVVAIIEREEP